MRSSEASLSLTFSYRLGRRDRQWEGEKRMAALSRCRGLANSVTEMKFGARHCGCEGAQGASERSLKDVLFVLNAGPLRLSCYDPCD